MSDARQEGEHEAELLLNRRTVRDVTRYLVRWRGHASADDEWLLLEELEHCPQQCPEKVAEYDAAAPRGGIARRPGPAAGPAVSPRSRPGAGAAGGNGGVSARGPGGGPDRSCPHRAGGALPLADRGWVRGTVARRTRAAGFTHMVRYGRTSALGRWVLFRRVR